MTRDRLYAIGLVVLKLLGLLMGYLLTLLVLSFIWVLFAGIDNYPQSFDAAQRQIQMFGGGLFMALVYLFYRRKGFNFKETTGLVKANTSKTRYALIAGLGGLANLLLVLVINILPDGVTTGYGTSVTEVMQTGGMVLNIISVLFFAPLVEELVFRGICLTWLSGCMKPMHAAVALSVVFGLSHGHPIWALYAMFMGFAFSVLRIRTGSVLPCIVAHFAFNATSLVIWGVTHG